MRLAVKSGLYPLYEVFDGERYEVNVQPSFEKEALAKYVQGQGRFRKGSMDLEALHRTIQRQWLRLGKLSAAAPVIA